MDKMCFKVFHSTQYGPKCTSIYLGVIKWKLSIIALVSSKICWWQIIDNFIKENKFPVSSLTDLSPSGW